MIDEKKLIAALHDAVEKDSFKELPAWILKVIEKQPEEGKWIPIGQYPAEPCLLCFENGEMVVGHFDYDVDMWKIQTDSEYYTNLMSEDEEPIAWQQLPKYYERD